MNGTVKWLTSVRQISKIAECFVDWAQGGTLQCRFRCRFVDKAFGGSLLSQIKEGELQ
ncbi:MAG: hypothetical protein OEY05_09625 [Paracoccaceae bacterium]|nr:hypothetical protein [Paracoccaceae bacterium]